MQAWMTYFKERFPLVSYSLLSGGLALSGHFLASSEFSAPVFLLVFFGVMLFFAELRLMDEFKDFEKDLIAHPTRPLPRGLIKPSSAQRAIHVVALTMALYSVVLFFLLNSVAGLSYLFVTAYLWLMYKEFYLGAWLNRHPVLYAVSHQIILFPLCYFTVVAVEPSLFEKAGPFYYGLTVLGSFFGYEICRKLNPQAHPVLKTYLIELGIKKTFFFAFATQIIAAVGAWNLDLELWLWPLEGAVLLAMLTLFRAPQKFKVVESLATLSLLAHIWAIAIRHFITLF